MPSPIAFEGCLKRVGTLSAPPCMGKLRLERWSQKISGDIKSQLPTAVIGLITHSSGPTRLFTSLPHLPTPLTKRARITSQINDLHSNPCSGFGF